METLLFLLAVGVCVGPLFSNVVLDAIKKRGLFLFNVVSLSLFCVPFS